MSWLREPSRRTLLIASVVVLAGVVGIAAGYVGAADSVDVAEQLAFAISGGLGGAALIGTGLGVLAIQHRRYEEAAERQSLDRVVAELTEVAELVAARRSAPRRRRRLTAR